MTELLFLAIGMMVIFFVIVGGLFWAVGFIADSFNPAFESYEAETDPYNRDP